MVGASRKLLERNSFFYFVLLTAFVISFSIPIVLVIKFGGVFSSASSDKLSSTSKLFLNAVTINSSKSYIQIAHSEELNPSKEVDFLMVGWFKFKSYPKIGEEIIPIAKFSPRNRTKPGFKVGVNREGNSIRPVVYWKDRSGKGRVHSFSEITIIPKSWILIAVSFVDGKYLAVYSASIYPDGTSGGLKLKGGYELSPVIVAKSDSDIYIGEIGDGNFRGKVGAFGIFSGEKLSNKIEQGLGQLIEKPESIPVAFGRELTRFWSVDFKEDLSGNEHSISLNAIGRSKNRRLKRKSG